MWALDNYLASQHWIHGRCLLVSYEHVTLNSIDPLLASLDSYGFKSQNESRISDANHNASATPSRVASPDLAIDDPAKQLSKWKKQLTEEEIDEILHIANGFGFTCFSQDPTPDFDLLQKHFDAKLIA